MHPLQRFTSTVLTIEAINSSLRAMSKAYSPRGPVIDMGSYYPPEYRKWCDRRHLFPALEYIGCDLRLGPGVDRIEDAESLSFPDDYAGAILLLEILEHLPNPCKAIAEARRVLRDDGLLVISVPFDYRLHGFPTDYWRFTASGVQHLLAAFPQKIVFSLGPRVKPVMVFAVAQKTETDRFAQARASFQAMIQSATKMLRRRMLLGAFQERGKEFFGLMLGRADLSISFHDPSQAGGYVFEGDPDAVADPIRETLSATIHPEWDPTNKSGSIRPLLKENQRPIERIMSAGTEKDI